MIGSKRAGLLHRTEDDNDDRLWLEWFLLPPGMTFPRAGSAGAFFLMLYGFVFAAWYVAVEGDVCATERAAAHEAEREVLKLRSELHSLQELRNSKIAAGIDGYQVFTGSLSGLSCAGDDEITVAHEGTPGSCWLSCQAAEGHPFALLERDTCFCQDSCLQSKGCGHESSFMMLPCGTEMPISDCGLGGGRVAWDTCGGGFNYRAEKAKGDGPEAQAVAKYEGLRPPSSNVTAGGAQQAALSGEAAEDPVS
mmetsp:Transcript_95596/g.213958  ORF Transcript_95596/g.213958 Transcript_95596/m.213958 type:complete len:251 (+) Transcript_95596:70-822(+)